MRRLLYACTVHDIDHTKHKLGIGIFVYLIVASIKVFLFVGLW
jgi:hypothetical protein